MVAKSKALRNLSHVEFVSPSPYAAALAFEAELVLEDGRSDPAVPRLGGGIALIAPRENIKAEGIIADVHQPILGNASLEIGVFARICG
jgi:hypothetical protein